MKKVAVIMGSIHDWPIVKKAVEKLISLDIDFEAHVFSAHRTSEKTIEFTKKALDNDFGVIIAAAGMAAHLAGVIAANTILPVIGLPLKSDKLDGIDALLSTVMMPPGIPVATVGIDAAENAALLAAQILALDDEELREKLQNTRDNNRESVLENDKTLQDEIKVLQRNA